MATVTKVVTENTEPSRLSVVSEDTSASSSKTLKEGEYAAPRSSDLRSPCPLLNAMANHGYIPRDGRNVNASELKKAMNLTGLSEVMGSSLAYPTYLEDVPQIEREGKIAEATRSFRSIFARFWFIIRNPWCLAFPQFGVWMPGQKDSRGRKVVNLDQIASHGRIEHDISLTRRDHEQGDNNGLQADLVQQLLACSSDGGRTLTLKDLCTFQRKRIEEQQRDNPTAIYTPAEFQISCGQIAMTLRAFGDGNSIPCAYAKALFEEERLPVKEGWTRRRWWTLGFIEVVRAIETVKSLVGNVKFSNVASTSH